MIRERYAIWNNKGGVGKSTLTFHIATYFAHNNPECNVLVVDMCPQANSTMMLLGSGTKGEETLIELENQDPAPTIAGYLANRINRQVGLQLPNEDLSARDSWTVRPFDFNDLIPSNLYLIPGDGNLELLAAPIAYWSNAQFPAGAWGAVHKWVRELTEEITQGKQSWTVFIDTNPSFSIYTELAMIASEKLIIPFNADDSSRHAVSAITRLLYGAGSANPVYDKFTFRQQTKTHDLGVPKLHLFVGNRFTQYKGAAKAFSALHHAVGDGLWSIYSKNPNLFTGRNKEILSKDDFLNEYSADVRDFNTAGVVAAHLGTLLTKLEDGTYEVHGEEVYVRADRIKDCTDALEVLVAKL